MTWLAVSRKSKERKKVHKLTPQSNFKKIPGVHIIKKEEDYARQRQFKMHVFRSLLGAHICSGENNSKETGFFQLIYQTEIITGEVLITRRLKPELWICQVIFIDYTIHKRYLVHLPLKSCSARIIALWSYTEFGRAYYLILILFNLVIELLQILSLWETSVWNLPVLFWKLKARQAQWPSSSSQLCPMQAL